MTPYDVNITRARLLRHAPSSSQGVEAAAVDIAQDLLLRHLHDIGLLEELAFKGGTALRKLYAGAQGRFSLDLDFSVRDLDGDAGATLELLVEAVENLELGPFRYGTAARRGADLPGAYPRRRAAAPGAGLARAGPADLRLVRRRPP